MTEKKMRKWLKTFVMLLPVVFVILFGVHLHRHDLPNEISVGNPDSAQTVYYNFESGTKTYEINEESSQYIYYEVFYPYFMGNLNVVELLNGETATVFYMGDVEQYTYTSGLYFNIQNSQLVYFYDDVYTIIPPQFLDGVIAIDEVVFDIYVVSFSMNISNPESFVMYYSAEQLLSYETTIVYNDYVVYDEPLEIIGYEFNNYLDQFYKFDIFNLTQFYDWSVNTFFNGTAPLYYKPVFSILVYEFVIELLFLMFSFITFLIRFAQKWIDGLYERRF